MASYQRSHGNNLETHQGSQPTILQLFIYPHYLHQQLSSFITKRDSPTDQTSVQITSSAAWPQAARRKHRDMEHNISPVFRKLLLKRAPQLIIFICASDWFQPTLITSTIQSHHYVIQASHVLRKCTGITVQKRNGNEPNKRTWHT